LAGKITLPNKDNDLIKFCKSIISENERKDINEKIRESEFHREKLGCLYIPAWTDESFDNFMDMLDSTDNEVE
jgi:hypothetical protein